MRAWRLRVKQFVDLASRACSCVHIVRSEKSLVLYRECGGAVVSGSEVVLIAAAFPIQH